MNAGAALVDADANLDAHATAVDAGSAKAASLGGEPSLADRFVEDAPGAFEAVVDAYQAPVARLAHRLLGWRSGADVEDVVQDVFFAALKYRRRFRRSASLGTWLTAITVNRCRTQQRRRYLARLLFRSRAPAAAGSDAGSPAWSAAAADEASLKVRSAVQALPPRDREVVVLRYFEQLGAAEIATVTGLSTNAVEVRLHRARAKLAVALGTWHREEQA